MVSRKEAQPDHLIRLVCVKITPHKKRGKTNGGTAGPDSDGILRIACDLLDPPAHVIAFGCAFLGLIESYITAAGRRRGQVVAFEGNLRQGVFQNSAFWAVRAKGMT